MSRITGDEQLLETYGAALVGKHMALRQLYKINGAEYRELTFLKVLAVDLVDRYGRMYVKNFTVKVLTIRERYLDYGFSEDSPTGSSALTVFEVQKIASGHNADKTDLRLLLRLIHPLWDIEVLEMEEAEWERVWNTMREKLNDSLVNLCESFDIQKEEEAKDAARNPQPEARQIH